MLDIKYIRENSDIVKEAAKNKLINVDIDRLLEVDEKLRKLNQEADKIKEERKEPESASLFAKNVYNNIKGFSCPVLEMIKNGYHFKRTLQNL